MNRNEKITARVSPCRCGCKGRDPWHAATFRRVVHSVESATGTADVRDLGETEITARGTVTAPWGDQSVVRITMHGRDFGWHFTA